MSTPTPDPEGFLLGHDVEGFLEALGLVLESGRATTPADLVRYAESADEPHAAEYLRGLAAEGLPLKLVFDAFSVHARIVAFKQNRELLAECAGKKVGLVLPLPVHVIEGFLSLPGLVVVTADGHHIPPPLRRRQLTEHKGSRAGRKVVAGLEVVVFEAFRKDGEFFVEPAVGDVVDPRIIPPTARFVVHLRPHAHPEDQPLDAPQPIHPL